MADDSLARIEERLARIEARLSDLEERTQPHVVAPPPPPSPPFTTSAFNRSRWPEENEPPFVPYKSVSPPPRVVVPPERPYTPQPPAPPKPLSRNDTSATASEDAEYKIGAQVLPRVGAVVFLIGVIYLVSLALSRHLITPQMQWAGELFLCLAFIVVGFIKRNEREDFGQLLIGIGSCGLYFSFAGAQAYKGIISGNQLVLLFIGLSFANLAFSWWRASRSFWIIGILGGIIGALMPLKEHNLLMNGSLQLSIVAAAALVAGRHKWFGFSILLFITAMGAASAALFPVYGDEWKQLSFLYLDALICLVAMASTRVDWEFDAVNALLPISAFGVGLLALAVRDGIKGCLHLCIFAVALAAISLLFNKASVARNRLLVASAAVALLLAPSGYTPNCVYIYGLIAAALAIASYIQPRKIVTAFCWTVLAFGLAGYLMVQGYYKPWQTDLSFCILLAGSCALAGFSFSRLPKMTTEAIYGASVLSAAIGTLFLLRSGYLIGIRLDPLHRDWLTQVVTALVLSSAAEFIALRKRYVACNVYAWILGAYSLMLYGALASAPREILPLNLHLSLPGELVLIVLLGGLVYLLVTTCRRLATLPFVSTLLGVGVLSCLFVRAGFIIGVPLDPTHRSLINQVFSAWLLAVGFSIATTRKGYTTTKIYSYLLGVYAFVVYLAESGGVRAEQFSIGEELLILALLSGYVLLQMRMALGRGLGVKTYGWVGLLIIACLFLRGGDIVGLLLDPLHRDNMTQLYSAVIVAFVCALLGRTYNSRALTVLACCSATYSALSYIGLAVTGPMRVNEDLVSVLVLMATFTYLIPTSLRFGERDPILGVGSAVFFGLAWRAGFLIFTSPMVGMKETAATTLTWTLYAVALISAGFVKKAQLLRYLALTLFGVTLGKVFLYDLSNLDAGIRVMILMGLGVAMIGGGYWYIRSRKPVLPGSA